MMKRFALLTALVLLTATSTLACVGKTIIVGTDSTPRSRVVAQMLAILINERTGTTVEVIDYADDAALFAQLTDGDVDLALDYAGRALTRVGKDAPADAATALEAVKKHYQEELNLAWLNPLGFYEGESKTSPAATVAQKHALKKFPALPRLIAKTRDKLPPEVLSGLAGADNIAKATREFLKKSKLI